MPNSTTYTHSADSGVHSAQIYNIGNQLTFDLNGAYQGIVQTVSLSISYSDVDVENGEQDAIFLNGQFIGNLPGYYALPGTASFTIDPSLLINGTNQIEAYATNDPYGAGLSTIFEVDSASLTVIAIAAPPIVTLLSTPVAGNSANLNIWGTVVQADHPVEGQTVTITDNGAVVGTAKVYGGNFLASVTLLNQGANNIVATVSDTNGNVGTSATLVDTLDTQPPTITFTSGAQAGNQALQTITGVVISGGSAAVVGQVVTLTENGKVLGRTNVLADGTFSTVVALPGQGANSIVASVSDNYGNAGISAALVDTLDYNSPTVTFTSTPEASKAALQTIAGKVVSGGSAAVVGQTVTLTDNGAVLGTAKILADGTFTASVTLSNQGTNRISASVSDSYGNAATSTPLIDTLDNTPPTITFTSVSKGTNLAGQMVVGRVISGGSATVAGQTVILTGNGTVLGTAKVLVNGTFSVGVVLPNQGANSIVATLSDSYGNVGISAALVYTLDNKPPTITITSTPEASKLAAQTITGKVISSGNAAVVGQLVTFTENGKILGTTKVLAGGTFSANVMLPSQGANNIVAAVSDSYGNGAVSAPLIDTLDSKAPGITFTSTAEASNVAVQIIAGKVVSGGSAAVVGQTVTLAESGKVLGTAKVLTDGTFAAKVALPSQGANSIVATMSDSYGNAAASAALVDTLDNTPPSVTFTSLSKGTNLAAQTVAGKVTSGGAATVVGQTITLTDNGIVLGTAKVLANGTFTASITLSGQGANSIVATLSDSYGNAGASAALVYTLDNIPPTVSFTSPAEASNVAGQVIAGKVVSGGSAAVVGQTVTLTDNGKVLTLAKVLADGTFTAKITLPSQGINNIVATVSDSYGNAGTSAGLVDALLSSTTNIHVTTYSNAVAMLGGKQNFVALSGYNNTTHSTGGTDAIIGGQGGDTFKVDSAGGTITIANFGLTNNDLLDLVSLHATKIMVSSVVGGTLIDAINAVGETNVTLSGLTASMADLSGHHSLVY